MEIKYNFDKSHSNGNKSRSRAADTHIQTICMCPRRNRSPRRRRRRRSRRCVAQPCRSAKVASWHRAPRRMNKTLRRSYARTRHDVAYAVLMMHACQCMHTHRIACAGGTLRKQWRLKNAAPPDRISRNLGECTPARPRALLRVFRVRPPEKFALDEICICNSINFSSKTFVLDWTVSPAIAA